MTAMTGTVICGSLRISLDAVHLMEPPLHE